MKVVCVDNDRWYDSNDLFFLTKGKQYNCVLVEDDYYLISLDNRYTRWFKKELFITKEEQRNQKLEELGI